MPNSLPDSITLIEKHRTTLQKKHKEYVDRLNMYHSPFSLIKKDIAEMALNSTAPIEIDFARRTLAERHGPKFSEELFSEAWMVVEDYCRTGGLNNKKPL